MEIDIKKYAAISQIAIDDTQQKDIERGVLDILNYVEILKNPLIKDTDLNQNNLELEETRYRENIVLDKNQHQRDYIFVNAPQSIKNYFVVPDLIIRKS